MRTLRTGCGQTPAITVGDVYEDEDGYMTVANGGVQGSYISYDRIAIQRHPTNRSELGM